ncbi:putative quinol monooxygenase [Paraburkholderia humisilvae]|uniref:(4S)-4-hydroxy-5-phosphonooxypentane-2,3-dione isomerase n=1 Tax=Paraburkholderia humisilvae TaxID=627669 RepID=A0A6J5F883_9BURK|nr:putative quinol monooxygenase [Paraburkholderia humisilvae]CAB3774714.1 (4S)-4-hydroxy-5-phosphonooxypentane-2,3-dione isomerase [Paraburkholderia humisilvae]
MASTVKIVAILTARTGLEIELEALLRGMSSPSRSEPGNLEYNLWRDIDNPGRFVLDELYKDTEAVAAHRATSHFQHYLSRINELAVRVAVTLDAVDVVNTRVA